MVSSGGLFCRSSVCFICFKEPYSTQGRKVEDDKKTFFYREFKAVALPDSKGPKAVQI